MLEVLFWLLVAHAVCDFSLQSDFLARAKNHRAPVLGVPFYQALGAHALIHAGGVFLVTGLPALAAAELIAHAAIDYAKADGASAIQESAARPSTRSKSIRRCTWDAK